MLVLIAYYGTIQMFTKGVLAVWYHWKWMITDCRCWNDKPMYEDRIPHVERFWNKINQDYLTVT